MRERERERERERVWGGDMVGPCYVVHYLVSSFAILSPKKKESWLFYFNCLLMPFDN